MTLISCLFMVLPSQHLPCLSVSCCLIHVLSLCAVSCVLKGTLISSVFSSKIVGYTARKLLSYVVKRTQPTQVRQDEGISQHHFLFPFSVASLIYGSLYSSRHFC